MLYVKNKGLSQYNFNSKQHLCTHLINLNMNAYTTNHLSCGSDIHMDITRVT